MSEEEITRLYHLGREDWPSLELAEEDFVRFVQGRSTEERIAEDRAADVYLACACSSGDEGAIAMFERRHKADMERALGRMALSQAMRDEMVQAVRTKLFMPASGGKPQIAKYGGRGRLGAWLRAVSVRTAIDMLRKENAEPLALEEEVLESLAETDMDPDLRALKAAHRDAVNQAFEASFKKLSARERNLLRQHYLYGLNIDQIGAMYKVHRATAFRWITRARNQIFSDARKSLAASLGESAAGADALLRLLQSQIDISIDRLLRSTQGAGPGEV